MNKKKEKMEMKNDEKSQREGKEKMKKAWKKQGE